MCVRTGLRVCCGTTGRVDALQSVDARNAVTVPGEASAHAFSIWARDAEPRLRHALTASFGPQVGEEAAADALSHAWEQWAEIADKPNPTGYVFGIARNKARRMVSATVPAFFPMPSQRLPDVEPGLPDALSRLPEQQRIVVALLYGYQWTMSEVAELLGTSKSTVQNHAERGLRGLRGTLGVEQ